MRRYLPLLVAVLVVTLGCDRGYNFAVRNDFGLEVIVLFGGSSDDPDVEGYAIPAGAAGLTLHGLGQWRGLVRVLDSNCNPLWEARGEAKNNLGIIVAADERSRSSADTVLTEGSEQSAITSDTTCASE